MAEDSTETNSFIDKMTLELLMNKTQFNKYIAKTDPKRYSEIDEYLSNMKKYDSSIAEITNELLENPEKQITTEINEAFEYYSKTLIRHFKMKEIEFANEYNKEDDVILFDKIVDVDSEEYRTSKDKKTAMTSFWSKEVVKKKNARTFPYV